MSIAAGINTLDAVGRSLMPVSIAAVINTLDAVGRSFSPVSIAAVINTLDAVGRSFSPDSRPDLAGRSAFSLIFFWRLWYKTI
ncbi:MAG: hypothetical protein IJM24_01925 [Clostridia bacterium]|nr:hypothetical protein [Clostridia bacterium]